MDTPTPAATTTPVETYYRLLYFNTRGAAEPIRYFFAVFNPNNTMPPKTAKGKGLGPYQDVRYPIQASAKGFGVDSTYLKHQQEGRFRANLDRLPILQIVERRRIVASSKEGEGEQSKENSQPAIRIQDVIVGEIGQTHSILRYLVDRVGGGSDDPLQRAYVDSFVEAIRDVKTAWFKAKKNQSSSDQSPPRPKDVFLESELSEWCQKLEASLPPTHSSSSSPWLFGHDEPSLADVCLYAMLATPTSLMTGSSQSFFDGADAQTVGSSYKDCERLKRSVKALAEISSVKRWEQQRPDTFN